MEASLLESKLLENGFKSFLHLCPISIKDFFFVFLLAKVSTPDVTM